jgi:hypothetical protein
MLFLLLPYLLLWLRFSSKTENPRLTGNRGFLENLSLCLPFYSRDAEIKAITLPDGHASIGQRVLQRWNIRGFHFQRWKETPFWNVCQRFFTPEKSRFSKLVEWRGGVKLARHERETPAHGHLQLVRDESLHPRRSAATRHSALH